MPSVAKTLLRRSAAVFATAVALLGAAGIDSASADVTYTSYTWTGDVVQITGPGENITGGSGQIQLHTTTGSTVLAWCLDIFDWLQNSGTYSVTANGPINGVSNPAEGGHIGALMLEGNQLIAANKGMTVDGYNFSVADESAAIQLQQSGPPNMGRTTRVRTTSPTIFQSCPTEMDSHNLVAAAR